MYWLSENLGLPSAGRDGSPMPEHGMVLLCVCFRNTEYTWVLLHWVDGAVTLRNPKSVDREPWQSLQCLENLEKAGRPVCKRQMLSCQ